MADATSTDSGLEPIVDTGLVFPTEEAVIVEPKKAKVNLPQINLPTVLQDLKAYDVLSEFNPLMAEQETYKQENGKYKQILKTPTSDDVEVHEYQCPNGEVGYQIFVYKKIGGKEYIKSFGQGQEKSARDCDWLEIIKDGI